MIQGYWCPKGSAKRFIATFEMDNLNQYTVTLEGKIAYRGDISKIQASARLGSVERKIVLEDGSLFTTMENDEVDKFFASQQKINNIVHYLETHYRVIVVAVVITIVSSFSFFKWGVPWASQVIAHSLPYETNKLIAAGSMKFLDKAIFQESNISKEQQEKISKHFYTKIAPLGASDAKEVVYKLHFRSWTMGNKSIPNALALPSGDIILTDKLIQLAKNQDEIDSVLLHEMGHIVHRHGLEMMIEGTFVTIAVMMIAGDTSGMGDFGIGLGTALVSSSYSRAHELEADLYAFDKMLMSNIDPASFSHIMARMTHYMKDNRSHNIKEKDFLNYFASHPSTKKRIEMANRYSECFKQGLQVCK